MDTSLPLDPETTTLIELNQILDERRRIQAAARAGAGSVQHSMRLREIDHELERLWCQLRVVRASLPSSDAAFLAPEQVELPGN